MRRIITLVSSLILIASLAGCNSKSLSAMELYTDAVQKHAEIESEELRISMVMSVFYSNKRSETTTDAYLKQINYSETDFDLEIDLDIVSEDQTLNGKGYYTDGVMYMETSGHKLKSAMDPEMVMRTDNEGTIKSYNIICGAEASAFGVSVPVEYNIKCEMVSINSISEIEFPDDLDTYKDML